MFSARTLVVLLVAATAAADLSPPPESNDIRYSLGQPLTPDQIAALDISVLPNGEGLPDGKGTARDGAKVRGVEISLLWWVGAVRCRQISRCSPWAATGRPLRLCLITFAGRCHTTLPVS